MTKKKVLQIVNYMYPHIGGIEQVARDFANALSIHSEEIEQKIICFNETASIGNYKCKRGDTVKDVVDDVDVYRCGCFAKIASQSLSLSYPKVLYKVLKEFNPDIVIFHYPNPFVASFMLPMLSKKVKLVVYWHLDITKQKVLGKLFHFQNIAIAKRADVIIGATPKHINESAYSKYFEGKKQVLPYMIDEHSLVINEEEKEKALVMRSKYKDKCIGFFIGRHVPYKGLRYLIEASKHIKDDRLHFLIAGNGELTEELKKLAKDDKKIEFIGRISESERRICLYACDIVCFPSITRNEAFGLALAEGMYFGKPAVTFKIPGSGVNYVNLDGITGIECPNCDSVSYANALIKLVNNEVLRSKMGNEAKKRICANFTVKIFENNAYNLIKSL